MKYLLLVALLSVLPFTTHAMIPLEMKFTELPYELQVVSICESGARQHYKSGELVKSETNDVGFMQINLSAHADTAKKLGFDITSARGNMAYGYYLYLKEGLRPWRSSSHCWLSML